MNTTAIVIGLIFGLFSAGLCYGVSMLASGLFARPVYRLYSRVLIGICCVMLLAPALRWLAVSSPMLGAIGLSIAQYLAFAVLGYGVYRFNRDYVQRLFRRRKTSAYFIFGTLAYAAVVTLVFLHVAVSGTPSWAGHGHGYLTAAHYGPLLVLLAMMVFNTDARLKSVSGNPRQFSRFTFVGYAISFLGLAVSIVPFIADALDRLSDLAVQSPWIQSVSSAEALLIAICLYGWLVWRYESIPPLFALLLAIIAEYHVLVTQWAIRIYGPEVWGLASLPLFAGVAYLDHYFSRWDERKHLARDRQGIVEGEVDDRLRFAVPFRVIQWGLASALFAITLWTHFKLSETSANWLGVTFLTYSVFFLFISFVKRQPSYIYLGGVLAGLAAIFGFELPGGPVSAIALAGLSALTGTLACLGERRGLKVAWRTPLVDIAAVGATLVIGLVFSRHLIGPAPYHFQAVGLLDGLALAGAMLACTTCALQVRSRLPVIGVLLAAVSMIPIWSAGLGLLATITASLIDRWFAKDRVRLAEDRVQLFGRYPWPFEGELPGLLSQPLSLGGIPLALLGLAISVVHVMQGDFSTVTLLGAAIAALVLLLLTRSYRPPWLYITGILATYFTIHAIAQGRWFVGWSDDVALAAHLTIAAAISLFGWLVASVHARWCTALLRRCAEEREISVQSNRGFYSGWLFHLTAIIALNTLVGSWLLWMRPVPPVWIMSAASMVAVLFALAASAYRTKLGSYLSLIALTLACFAGFQWLNLPFAPQSTVLAGLSLLAAMVSCFSHDRSVPERRANLDVASWLPAIPGLPATGHDLWLRPLALYALICSPIAVLSVMQGDSTWSLDNIWTRPAPLTYALASVTLLLSTRAYRVTAIYVASIALAFAAFHSAAQWALNHGWVEAGTSSIHLLVGSLLSLTGCLIAIALTWLINRRIASLDNDRASALRANREFYAGLLHHVALFTATSALFGLFGMALFDSYHFTSFAAIHAWTAGILFGVFSISGFIYLSRLVTYAALASVVVATLAIVLWLEIPTYQGVAAAVMALVFGIGAWLTRLPNGRETESERDEQTLGMSWRFNQCWQRAPLPLVSRDRTLWAKPLSHASTVLALAALVPIVALWGRSPVWLTVLPIYLASCTWLLATHTYGFGLLAGLDRLSHPSVKSSEELKSDAFERGLLYAASIVAYGGAMHATAQLGAFAGLPDRTSVAWHLVLATGLSMIGWGVATVISMRLPDRTDEGTEIVLNREPRELYSGLLHHLVMATGIVVLLVAVPVGLPGTSVLLPLTTACGMLVLYFALAGATYRSQLGSYLSLTALGWLVAQLSLNVADSWEPIRAMSAAALSLLGLALMTIAAISSRMVRRKLESSAPRPLLPTAWSSPSLPLRANSWSTLWFNPLRQFAFIFVSIGVMLVVANIALRGSWDGWSGAAIVTLLASALSFAIASKLYNTDLSTYVAIVLVVVGVFPLLQSQDALDARLGVAWSVMAMVFWLVGYVIERISRVAMVAESDQLPELPLTRIYERPLIRSSAVLAILAIGQSLYVWWLSSGTGSLTPLVAASAAGTLSLLLNARSMNVLHRFSLGRMLVYLACLATTVCSLTVSSTRGGIQSIGPNAVLVALIFASFGLVLMEWIRWRQAATAEDKTRGDKTPGDAASLLTFAEPLTNSGSVLALVASLTTLAMAIESYGASGSLALVTSLAGWIDAVSIRPVAFTFSIAALVSLMTVRASRVVIWLDVAVVLGSSGLLLLANDAMDWSTATLTPMVLFAMNGLVLVSRLVQFRPRQFASWFGLTGTSCEGAFFRWPLVVGTICLVLQTLYLASILTGFAYVDPNWTWLLNCLLCAALFFRVMYLQPHPGLLHLLVASTVVGFFGACLTRGWDVTTDVALSVMGLVWGMVAVQFGRPLGNRVLSILRLPLTDEQKEVSGRALVGWAVGMTGLAVVITLPIHFLVRPHFPNLSVTLVVASATCLLAGVRWQNVISTTASAVLFPAFLVATAALYVDPLLLRDVAGLATGFLALAYLIIETTLRRRNDSLASSSAYLADVGKSLLVLVHLLALIAVVLTLGSMATLSPSLVYALTMVLVAVVWLWMAWESGRELLVYASVAAVFTSLLYLCMVLLGLRFERSPIVAFSVIGYSFALYGLNILVGRVENPRAGVFLNPTYYMALVSPIVLAAVTPLDQKVVSAFVCLAAGAFYLIVSQRTHVRWTLYIAAGLFNLAIYLWIPEAKALTGLAQLYVIPAAVTVLIFAQLHRQDLNPQALSGIRTAAAGAILAVSTWEVFFASDTGLLQFVAVLLLSLAGIATGISLRIRPFVSIGIAFLMINVLGQLGLQFHQEGGIIRAVILIGLGILVLATMIFFNVHRERIMRRYRGFVADENWE